MRCNAHEGVYEQGKEAGIKIGEINGKRIGEEYGKKIGEKSKSYEIAKKMLLKGTCLEDIAELTDLSLSEVENLSNELKKEATE